MVRIITNILLLFCLNATAQKPMFFSQNYTSNTGYSAMVQTDYTKVGSVDQSNFGFLVSITNANFKSVANGGYVTSGNIYNIVASTDAAGTSLLDFEIEKWDAATGQLVIWVRIPTLSHTAAYTFYLHCGDATVTDRSNKNGVWESAAKMVHHFGEAKTAASQTISDATSNALNLTTQGSSWGSGQTAAGVIGDATSCIKANGNYLSFTQQTLSGDFTLTGHIKISVQNQNSVWFGRSDFEDDFNWYAGYGRYWTGSADLFASSTQTPTATWEYFVLTRSGTSIVLYEDGTSHATATSSFSIVIDQLAKQRNYATSEDIVFDEFRYYNAAKTSDWVTCTKNNQVSNSTSFTITY